jgi:uncharacterized protein with ParB-like and HNH nuclease domain
MPKPYDADTRTVAELLSTPNHHLQVPLYQRSYSWRTNEVKEFWDDVTDFAKDARPKKTEDQYFLGSIVLVERANHLELLDGQQRLATATILLAVIRNLLAAETEEWQGKAKQLQDYIITTQFGGPEAARLILNQQDRLFFRQKIQEPTGASTKVPPNSPASLRLINGAYNLLRREAVAYRDSAEKGSEQLERLALVLLHNVSIVACTSTSYDTAAAVFETLNDRGIELSSSDLLRTWLLGEAGSDELRDEIASAWETIFAIHGDAKVDDFIRHYWLSHHGDVKKRQLYKEIRDWIKKNKKSPLEFSLELADAATVYQELAGARSKTTSLRKGLEAVRSLGAKALMPALLSLWQTTDETDAVSRSQLLDALVALYVRHILIGGRDNSELEQTVFGVAQGLREKMTPALALQRLQAIAPKDDEFEAEFTEASIARTASAAYVLRELEHEKRPTKELKVETPDLVHVEHIYPQNPPRAQRWDEHDLYVNRIGNLTPLGAPMNQSLQNSPFTKKRPEYAKSDLLTTQELAKFDDWSPNTIAERQAGLAELAVKIWPYPT